MRNITLSRASINDCRDLWLWRNHPGVRKNFFDSEPISWQEHERWFNSKNKDGNIRIYIAALGDDKIGVIRFETANGQIKVSVNLNPDFFNRGLGSKIIKIGTGKFIKDTNAKKPIIAEIKKDNIASKKAFTKAGYTLVRDKKDRAVYEKR